MLKNNCVVSSDEILQSIAGGEDISLTNCTIQKGKAVPDLTLINMTVNSIIRVIRCPFEIKVIFDNVTFMKDVSFEGTWFHEGAFFTVNFEGEANFSNGRFTKTADFSGSRFLGTSLPDETPDAMRGEANFSDARFTGVADFSGCEFFRARFTNAVFNDNASFSGVTFNREVSFNRVIFEIVPEITGTEFRDLEAEAKTLRSLGQASKNSYLNREAARLFDKSGEAFEEEYRAKETKQECERQDYDNVLVSYRLAEEAYDSIKERKEAGRAYKKGMEFRLLHTIGILERIWLRIRKYTSDYGESPGLFLAWVFAIITFFALIYIPADSQQWKSPRILLWLIPASILLIAALSTLAFKWLKRLSRAFMVAAAAIIIAFALSFVVKVDECDIFSDCHNARFHDIVRGFYFSFTTFTTLGFGDVAPLNDWAAIVISLEVLSGYVMFGVLLTLLARKIIR